MRALVPGTFLALVAAPAMAAFTPSLGAFQADLVTASEGLSGLTDPASVQQKKAVDRALAAVLSYSSSLGRDLATSVKVGRLLERSFPTEAPLLAALDGTLDSLEAEVVEVRDLLATDTGLVTGAKLAGAEKALASVDASLVLADLSDLRTGRAALLKKAALRAEGARRSLRKGLPGGFQGPRNGSFEDEGVAINEASYWTKTVSGGDSGTLVHSRSQYGVISDGIYDLDFALNNGSDPNILSARQDGVLLTQSHRLLFDYSLNLLVYACGQGAAMNAGASPSVRIEVLFIMEDPDVTVLLWSRELSGLPKTGVYTIEEVADQVVDLPFLPSRGTLVLRVTGDVLNCGGFITGTKGHVQIDHVRVD